MEGQKPSIGRIVVYNHPGSADGKYPPMQSPAVIQKVYTTAVSDNPEDGNKEVCDIFVMSVTGGIFFGKSLSQGDGPSEWNWPPRV